MSAPPAAALGKAVAYEVPGMDAVTVQHGINVSEGVALDLYRPLDPRGTHSPVVVFVLGFSNPVYAQGLKDTGQYVSWARLVAASGMAAVTYSYRDPVADRQTLLRYLRDNADELAIDRDRVALWACSGNVPSALSTLMGQASSYLKAAVLSYGYMLDAGESTAVAEASSLFEFSNPVAGRSPDDLPDDVPLLVVRAGQDEMPGLNHTIDHFVTAALASNLPVTVVNHPTAPHAFDLADDGATTRQVIATMLAFLRGHLL